MEIKDHKKWKYENILCVGCNINNETENELLECSGFSEGDGLTNDNVSYSAVFGNSVSDMVKVAKEVRRRLKIREKLMENG